MTRKKLKEKNGAALVVAVVIMLLVVMLSSAMLLISYSLYNTSYRQSNMDQCKEIAQGISREIRGEVQAGNTVKKEDMERVLNEGTYPLWGYLRCNLWQTSWPYFNEDEARHQRNDAYREFQFEYTGLSEQIPGEVTVVMYRESSRDDDDKTTKGSSEFYIQVTCQIGKQKSTITSQYELTVEPFDPNVSEKEEITPSGSCNPESNTINLNEKWIFSGGDLE